MPVKGTSHCNDPIWESDRTFQCTRPPQLSRTFERKRRIVLSGRVPNIWEVRQRYISQCPADSESLPMGFSPLGFSLRRSGDSTAIQQASSIWWRSHVTVRQRMAMKSFHGEAVSGWRGSHPTARQGMAMGSFSRWFSWHPADGEGAMPQQDSGRIARDSSVHQRPILVLTSNRAFSGVVKNRASVQWQSESGTGWCEWGTGFEQRQGRARRSECIGTDLFVQNNS